MAYIGRVLLNQDAVAKALEEKGVKLEAAQRRALKAGGEIVKQRMIQSAHAAFISRSGKLVGGIRAKRFGTGVKIGVWTSDVEYAYYVEKGHAPPYRAKRVRSRGADARSAERRKRTTWQASHRSNGGRTPPHPYIEPVAASSVAEAEQVITETIRREAGL